MSPEWDFPPQRNNHRLIGCLKPYPIHGQTKGLSLTLICGQYLVRFLQEKGILLLLAVYGLAELPF